MMTGVCFKSVPVSLFLAREASASVAGCVARGAGWLVPFVSSALATFHKKELGPHHHGASFSARQMGGTAAVSVVEKSDVHRLPRDWRPLFCDSN